MRNSILYILLLIVLSVSCVREAIPEKQSDLQTVSVPLFVSIEEEDGTKAGDVVESKISNLWVIQFNGTEPESMVLGEPIYIEDFSKFSDSVELVPTKGKCAICFLANTFEVPGVLDIDARTTVEDMLNLRRVITRESQILGNSYTIFNAWVEQKIEKNGGSETGTPSINVALKRNVAKVDVKVSVTGEALDEDMTVTDLQFCSVPSVSYYVTNRDDLKSPFPLSKNFSKVNYQTLPWVDADADNSMLISTYLPVNMRGKGQAAEEKDKNKYAPDGATYLKVNAVYGEERFPITYIFYLGENMKDDYNLKPNHYYSYKFTISSIGDAASDSRVTDWGLVDFTKTETYPLSNSYILNPNPTEGQWRRFHIPIEKANIFWGNQGYADNSSYMLGEGDWECYVLASDFLITNDNFKLTSPGKDDTFFEISVVSKVEGNVIIAVKHKDMPFISWSWHLWITEYDPYDAFDLTGTDEYIYPVTGGAVHRYEGDFWAQNDKSFIMDRNLGALSDKFYESGQGFVYFQYGRKDPFFVDANMYKVGKNNLKRVPFSEESMTYSVMNPLSYIDQKDSGNQSWIYDEKYSSSKFIWNDPLLPINGSKGKKSMFDPCPPGYRLPEPEVFNDLQYNRAVYSADINDKKVPTAGQETNTTNVPYDPRAIGLERGFARYKDVKGVQYWPCGESGEQIPEEVIFFPAMGNIKEVETTKDVPVAEFRTAANKGTWMSLWTSIPDNAHKGKRLFGREGSIDKDGKIGAGNMNTTVSALKARAQPVRCITDN